MPQAAISGSDTNQGQRLPQEPEIEIVEEGSTPQGQQPQTNGQGQQAQGQGYEYPDDDDDGDHGDTRTGSVAGGGQTAQQAGDDQQQSAQELTARQRRRQRERNARNADRAELIQLRQQVAQLQGRFEQQDQRIASSEVAGLEGQIGDLESEIQRATTVMSRAMAAQNGDDFAQAMQIRDVLRDRLQGLKAQRTEKGGDSSNAQGNQGQSRQVDPRQLTAQQLRFASIFAQRHPWYKHGSGDQDTQMVVQIDNEMTAQGLNPSTPEYWMELERRVREDLPHKFQAQRQGGGDNPGGGQNPNNGSEQNGSGNTRRGGGPKLPGGGNSGGSNGGGGPAKFHISAARKQALIDLGVWDDPEQRMKHIKRFMAWDKDHSAQEQK